jgi:calcium-independent phospholipase A2-gamma
MFHAQVRSFEQQFRPNEPSRDRLKEVWQRLLRDKASRISTSSHPKGFVMAVLYMLHIERDNQDRRPKDEHGRTGLVSAQRRELLKRYGNWVPCQCGRLCGRDWNFANDVGIYRGGQANRTCGIARLLEASVMDLLLSKKPELWEKTRQAWLNSKVAKS